VISFFISSIFILSKALIGIYKEPVKVLVIDFQKLNSVDVDPKNPLVLGHPFRMEKY